MKVRILSIVLILTSTLFAQNVKTGNVLIEDFEDRNAQNNLGAYWYTFDDNAAGGKSALSQEGWQKCFFGFEGYQSKGMLNADVVLNKGKYQWTPYYSFGTSVSKTISLNPNDFAGFSYWHKGVGHTVRVETPEVRDYDYYSIAVPASLDWKLITIDFKELNQEGWGKRENLNLDNSIKLVWCLNKASGSFQIDLIQFEKEIIYEKQFNMEILPAQIPIPLTLKGNVNTPLNELSKKYLTKGVNLQNWGESAKITSANPKDWKYDEETIKLQADQGILGIRFPIDLDLYLKNRADVLNGNDKNITFEPILFTVLDSMNNWTKKYGLSYTIDYHAYDGTYNRENSKDSKFRESMAGIWKEIAEHYLNEKREDLFFELTNEPCLSLADGEYIDQEDWTLLANMMIDSIRSVDKNRPVIFGDTKWYSLDELILNKPFSDKFVIYCFHMYDPFVFSHQGASWTNMGSVKGIPFPYSAERWSTEYRDFGVNAFTPDWVKAQMQNYYKEGNEQFIKNRLTTVKNWAFDHKVPLICNEWGAYSATAKIEDLNAYFKTMGKIFKEMDISWQVWFGIMDNEMKLLPGMAEALDLKQSK